MNGRDLLKVVGVLAMAASVTVCVPEAQAADPVEEASSGASVAATESQAHAIRFRTSMGLRNDLDFVRVMEGIPGAVSPVNVAGKMLASADISTELGIPLTLAEQKEMDLRHKVIEDDVPLIKRLAKEVTGEEPAGVFMDNQNGGVLTVSVVGDVERLRSQLSGKVRHPNRLRVVTVGRSMDDLKTLAAHVRDDRERGPISGVTISGFAVSERKNRVKVDAQGDVTALQEYFDDRYGAGAVYVETGNAKPVRGNAMASPPFRAGVNAVNSPPFRGGQSITGRAANGNYGCTSGFVVWRGASSSKNYYMLTAGHCGPANPYDTPFYQANSVAMGRVDFYDQNGTDAMVINISNTASQWNNEIALAAGDYRAITSSQGQGADTEGDISCITGMNFAGARCGDLINTSYDYSSSDFNYTTGREVDADCNGGDSGGPAFYGNQARGTISLKISRPVLNDTCVYTHIYDNLTSLGSTMATSG